MASGFDPGALLARYYVLPRGPRVCLRLMRTRDADGVARLLRSRGLDPEEFGLSRLVPFDLRHRIVICATALIGSAETVVGIGSIELAAEPAGGSVFVLADETITEGLEDLLEQALLGRAEALTRSRAA